MMWHNMLMFGMHRTSTIQQSDTLLIVCGQSYRCCCGSSVASSPILSLCSASQWRRRFPAGTRRLNRRLCIALRAHTPTIFRCRCRACAPRFRADVPKRFAVAAALEKTGCCMQGKCVIYTYRFDDRLHAKRHDMDLHYGRANLRAATAFWI